MCGAFFSRENLSVESNSWYLKYIIVNVCLFLVLFFLTTPAYIVSLLDSVKVSDELEKMASSPLNLFINYLFIVLLIN